MAILVAHDKWEKSFEEPTGTEIEFFEKGCDSERVK